MKSRLETITLINLLLLVGSGLIGHVLVFVVQTLIPHLANLLNQFSSRLPPFLELVSNIIIFLTGGLGGFLMLLVIGWMIWTQSLKPASERILLRNSVLFIFLLTVCTSVLLIYAAEFIFTIPRVIGRAFLP